MDAKTIKHFFKNNFSIPVRVKTGVSKRPYIQAWISPEPREKFSDPLIYKHKIPPELGKLCLQVIYKGKLEGDNNYAGNVMINGVAMFAEEWEQVIKLWEEKACK